MISVALQQMESPFAADLPGFLLLLLLFILLRFARKLGLSRSELFDRGLNKSFKTLGRDLESHNPDWDLNLSYSVINKTGGCKKQRRRLKHQQFHRNMTFVLT